MKKALIALAIALVVPAQSDAQFFKKLGKVLEGVGEAAVEVLSNAQSNDNSSSNNSSSSKSDTKSSAKTNATTSGTTDNVQRTFSVQATDFSMFAVLNADDVNIRKEANANSGKLMMWSSDGGSYDTVTKLFFSDENKGRYRANAKTGAFIQAIHYPKGTMLPYFMENDGWLAIDVSGETPEINGAFIMSKFCDLLAVEPLGSTLICPVNKYIGMDGSDTRVTLQKIYCRTTGKFTDLPFAVASNENAYSDEYGYQIQLCFPIKVSDRYINTIERNITLRFDDVSTPRLEWIEEGGMDDYVSEELYLTMRKVTADQVESAVAKIFLNMDEAAFTKLIDKIFEYNTVNKSGANYFKGDDGQYHRIGGVAQSPFFVNKTKTVTIGTGKKYSE